jgi:two-component system sporulation sensor kinase A
MPSQVQKVSASTDTVHAHTFPVDERMRVYAHVFEAIGQPLIVTDLTGSIVYWNGSAATVFGKHRDEMVGRSVMAVADGDEWRLKITHVLEEVGQQGQWNGELMVQRSDGALASAVVNARLWHYEQDRDAVVILVTSLNWRERSEADTDRQVIRRRGQNADLPRRFKRRLSGVRRANRRLRDEIAEYRRNEQELRFQAKLLATVSQAVLATDTSGAITYWSPSAERMFGWSAAEMIGAIGFYLVAGLPDLELIGAMRAAIGAGKPWEGEFMLRRRDGTIFPAYAAISPIFDEQNRRIGAVGVVSDITERKRDQQALADANIRLQAANADLRLSHDLLHTIVDNLDDALALIDNQRVIQVVNRQFARLLDMPPEHLPGASCDDVCPMVAPIVARTLSGGVKVFERVSHTHPSGEVITLDVYGIPLRDASGAQRVVLRLVDVTERLQLEAIMRQNERLAASGRLAAAVAHEINTPLQSIQNYLYLLRSSPAEQSTAFLDLASSEITRVSTLLHRLLDLHRPGHRLIELIDSNAIIERVVLLLGSALRGCSIRVEQELAPDLPQFLGQRDALMQVLLNLLLNAIDAMPCGGVLRIVTRQARETIDQSERWCVQIIVADNGPGIAFDLQERIFDPFFTTKPHGSGLGLAVSRQLVEQHGGSLRVQSIPGSGATFIVSLPVAEEA